jgi:hypothetical protein
MPPRLTSLYQYTVYILHIAPYIIRVRLGISGFRLKYYWAWDIMLILTDWSICMLFIDLLWITKVILYRKTSERLSLILNVGVWENIHFDHVEVKKQLNKQTSIQKFDSGFFLTWIWPTALGITCSIIFVLSSCQDAIKRQTVVKFLIGFG